MHILNLSVAREDKPLLSNISFTMRPGSLHMLMGPNGSGKSSLAYALMGHPAYTITHGSLMLDGEDITAEPLHKRAQRGLFLSYQHPLAIPGLQVITFLQEAYRACKGETEVGEFYAVLIEKMDMVQLDYAFAYRTFNEGFSGGERKKLEMLQLLLLQPKIAILDEIDSGLDIDALKIIMQALSSARKENPELSLLVITHYPRIADYLVPDAVHILHKGCLVRSADKALLYEIEKHGYDIYSPGESINY